MKNYKNYLLIAIFSFMSFVAGLTISEAKASVKSSDEMHLGIHYETIYVDGQKYLVFTSSSSSMVVIKK